MNIFHGTILLLSLLLLAPVSIAEENTSTGMADYLFLNGKIFTVDSTLPHAEAVAVKDNRIIFVGTDHEAAAYIGPDTNVTNLSGAMILPGFIDGHNHMVSGAYVKQGVNLDGSKNKAAIIDKVQTYVKEHPDLSGYTGYGWSFPMFGDSPPTRMDLDTISDKPILLFNEDTHNLWFNTAAMEVAGLSAETPDPKSGARYERLPDGSPSGIAVEMEAWGPIALACGILGEKEMLSRIMEEVIPTLPKAGITACHDMGIWTAKGLSEGYLGFELLQEWEKEGRLPIRVVGVYGLRAPSGDPSDHIKNLSEWHKKYHSDLVEVNSLKIWYDGTPNTYTSVMLKPYENTNITGRDKCPWTTELLQEYITEAYKAGFDVHIHAIGDGSVRSSLDAFENTSQIRPENARPTIHHLEVIHPDDIRRFKELDIRGDATLEWLITYWDDALRLLGKERREQEWDIWKKLIDSGVNVSFGSDLPGTDPDEIAPLCQMQVALTGKIPGRSVNSTPPAWRIPTLEEMVYGYTMAGASQMGKENLIGSITTGKLADMIILEKDIFEVPPEELDKTKILLTMMNGTIVYQDPSFSLHNTSE